MSKSPGHQKHPEHKVREQHLEKLVTVAFNGQVIAESKNVIQVDEDHAPRRHYFPRADVRMDLLIPSDTTSECPFKGRARYFDLEVGGTRLRDAVWSYETPYDEHADLAQRLAFYDDKHPAITVTTKA